MSNLRKEIKILHAFNSGDTLRKFRELILMDMLVREKDIQEVYMKLDSAFHTGRFNFLRDTTTEKQAEVLIANGELWSHKNMYNHLINFKEQPKFSKRFSWLSEY